MSRINDLYKMDIVEQNKFLNKYFDSSKHQEINMGNTLINYMGRDSINKIEAQKWKGLDDTSDNTLKDLLYKSDFISQRQRAAKWYNTDGYVALVLLYIGDETYLKFGKVTDSKGLFNGELHDLTIQGEIVTYKDTSLQESIRWYISEAPETKGKVIQERFVHFDGKKELTKGEIVYPAQYKTVPGQVIYNNAERTPDWYDVVRIAHELNQLSNDLAIEWENIKTMWQSMNEFGSGRSAEKRQRSINDGARISNEEHSQNGRYAQQFTVAMSGSSTPITLAQILDYLEDKFLKYSFQGRQTTSTGSNKHNSEVSLFNQAHSEYIERKKKQRENDFMRFFNKIAGPLNFIAPQNIKIESSAYEQGKRDAMMLVDSQIKNQKSLAKYQNEQAKKTKEETKQLGKPEPVAKTQN